MRIRYLKPGFFKNEDLSALSPLHRLLFAGLWLIADKAGRLEDRPRRIRGELFPYDDDADVEAMLTDLATSGFLIRYGAEDRRVIQIAQFPRHQRPHKNEPVSELQEYEQCPSDDGHCPSDTARFVRGMGNGERGTGNGKKSVSAEPLARSTPPVVVFPTHGRPKTYDVTEAQIADWQADYPQLDIPAQCRQASAWVKANPSRRKTARGMPTFLVGWFNRSTNRGGGGAQPRDGPELGTLSTRMVALVQASKGAR